MCLSFVGGWLNDPLTLEPLEQFDLCPRMMMPLSLFLSFTLTVHTFFTGLAVILISQGQASCIEDFIYIGEWLNYPLTIEQAT